MNEVISNLVSWVIMNMALLSSQVDECVMLSDGVTICVKQNCEDMRVSMISEIF